jgi:hypothetical protein
MDKQELRAFLGIHEWLYFTPFYKESRYTVRYRVDTATGVVQSYEYTGWTDLASRVQVTSYLGRYIEDLYGR